MEQGLTTTGHVTTPNPAVATLANDRALISAKKDEIAAAQSTLQVKEGELDALRIALGDKLTLSARNSQEAVGGDRTKMEELMIPLRAIGSPTTDTPPPIVGLHVNDGDLHGEGDWSWPARRPGRPLYHLETAAAPTGPWTRIYTGLKSRCTTTTTPGTEFWARVCVELNGFCSDPSSSVAYRPH
jgi:hypothetical protein